jgi:hypothetical protein
VLFFDEVIGPNIQKKMAANQSGVSESLISVTLRVLFQIVFVDSFHHKAGHGV